jgi:iron complex outermembrane receptor protein
LVDKDRRVLINQTGAVLQLEKSLPSDIRFITALRLDNHSNLGNFLSPKFALTKKIGENNFRATWARAYSMPSIFFQYANSNGIVYGNGAGIRYIPNGSKYNEASIKSTKGLEAEETNTWELGYRGKLLKKLYIDINYYNSLNMNFLSPPLPVDGRALDVNGIPVVPAIPGVITNDTLQKASFNSFFNYGKVKAYGIDIGLTYSFNTFVNFTVKYSWFGSDITTDEIKNDANKDGFVSLEEASINAPKNKIVTILGFQNLWKQKVFVNISARFTGQHDFYSGSHIGTALGKGSRGKVFWGAEPLTNEPRYYIKNFDWGPLGGFTIIDLSAGCKLNNMTSLNMGVTNLLNSKQLEFVGSPPIGRLIMFELKVHLPNSNKKQK